MSRVIGGVIGGVEGFRDLARSRPAGLGLASLAVLVVIALTAAVVPRSDGSPELGAAPSAALELDGPARLDAGSEWQIEVAGVPDEATAITALVIGPWGVRSLDPVDPEQTVVVPAELTQQSGRLLASVRAGSASGEIVVEVVPGPPVDGIVPLAGPRSVVADRAHWTMVTSFPRDRFGNAVVDGTPLRVLARRPDGRVEQISAEVEHMLAATRVFSHTLAGRTAVRIDASGRTGPEVEVLEVPGPPTAIPLRAPEVPLRADGRMLVTVTTGPLADRFGNALLDGTAVIAHLDGPSGRSTLRTVTFDGRAELVVEAPPEPGTVAVEAVVDGVRSDALMLEFGHDVSELPVVAERVGGDVVRVRVGPVLTRLGGFVPDGTELVAAAGEQREEAELRDGVATVEVDADPQQLVRVEVLGVVTEVVAP